MTYPIQQKKKRYPVHAMAYTTDSGKVMLHPKYFEGCWTDEHDLELTGYILDGKIVSPQYGHDNVWEPEEQPLENCFFEGDLLPIIL